MATLIQATATVVSSAPRPISRRLRLLELLAVVFSSTYIPYLGAVFYVSGGSIQYSGANWYRAAHMFGYEFAAIILVAYVLFRRESPPKSIGLSLHWDDLLLGIGIWVCVIAVGSAFAVLYFQTYRYWYGAFPVPKDVSGILNMQPTAIWFALAILNGIFEEGIVRGFVMSDIKALTGSPWLAALISVALQVGYHSYQGITNVILLIPVFSCFALYFAKTGRITPLIIAHTLQDIIVLARHH
jgi:membrane protease YdiL (CAAX protease family)